MNYPTRQMMSAAFKVAVSILIVAGFGAAFLTLGGPEPGVAEAEADILSLDFFKLDKHQRFVKTLQHQGMSDPRSYDWNGNKMFFSSSVTDESPMQVLRRMQDAFVRNDVNKRTYLKPPFNSNRMLSGARTFRGGIDAYRDLLDQAMIPMVTGPNRVVMTGVQVRGNPDPEDMLASLWSDSEHVSDSVKQIQYLEAYRTSPDGRTNVTAVWSDDNLDMAHFGPDAPASGSLFGGRPTDSDIPVCPGCTRKRRFAGERNESGFIETRFVGELSPRRAINFYVRALPDHGWQPSVSQRVLAAANTQDLGPVSEPGKTMLSYNRDGESLQVLIYADPQTGKTTIHFMRIPAG